MEFEEMKLPEVSDFSKGRQAPSGGYLPMYLVGGGVKAKYTGGIGR